MVRIWRERNYSSIVKLGQFCNRRNIFGTWWGVLAAIGKNTKQKTANCVNYPRASTKAMQQCLINQHPKFFGAWHAFSKGRGMSNNEAPKNMILRITNFFGKNDATEIQEVRLPISETKVRTHHASSTPPAWRVISGTASFGMPLAASNPQLG